MFKKLRNRFVMIIMLSLTVVVTAALAGIYFALQSNMQSENRSRLQTYKPAVYSVHFQASDGEGIGEMKEGGIAVVDEYSLPLDYSASFQLLLDTEGNILFNDSVLNIEEETYREIAAQAMAEREDYSVLEIDGRKWQYLVEDITSEMVNNTGDGSISIKRNNEGISITFLDVTEAYASMNNLALVLLCVGMGMLVLFLFTSIIFANKAITPIAETWESQKRFVADASHELKTPLAIINANMEALLSSPDKSVGSQQKWIEHSQQAVDRTSRLLNDMLQLSALENPSSGSMAVRDFSEIVNNTIYSMEAVIYERGLKLLTEIAPNIKVYGDADRLGRLVLILLENAVKYCNDAGVIDIKLHGTKHAILAITNTGEGIAAEDLPHLFERFYRGDKSHSSSGYGLGLSLAKAIADSMEARIEVQTIPGEYTRFVIHFAPAPVRD